MKAAKVRPDNSKAKRLLANIEKNRDRNNPALIPEYECKVYTKMELDVAHAEKLLKNKTINKHLGFVSDYLDTSVVSGIPYLPVMISETVSRKYHSSDPALDREIIEASKISGIDENNNNISQYTGSIYLNANFYDNFIKVFSLSFPSPIGSNGDQFYNYYIIDSLSVKGEKTYQIRFHPKKGISSAAFDGEMFISAEDWGLREIHARLSKQSNVNWIRNYVIDTELDRTEDGRWFYKKDRMFADFSLVKRDSSGTMSVFANRELYYSEVRKDPGRDMSGIKKKMSVEVRKGELSQDNDYWDGARPYALSDKEKDIYVMVDSIKTVPFCRNAYTILNTAISGHIDTKYVGLGPLYKMVSFSEREGVRFQLEARTTAEFSQRTRLSGYAAYGTKSKRWKGGGTLEYMLSKEPTRKVTIDMQRDMVQLGKGTGPFAESNFFSSLLTKANSGRRNPVNSFSFRYDMEINRNFNVAGAIEHKRIYSNDRV